MEKDLEMIKELMEELQKKMEHTPEDFASRLGRHKPGIEVIKMEGKLPMKDMPLDMGMKKKMGMEGSKEEEDMESPMEEAKEMKDIEDVLPHKMGMGDEEEYDFDEPTEESMLKKRLMKLRR